MNTADQVKAHAESMELAAVDFFDASGRSLLAATMHVAAFAWITCGSFPGRPDMRVVRTPDFMQLWPE